MSVTAHITSPTIRLTATLPGELGNLIGYKEIIDPAGATGATTVVVSDYDITVKLKNDGAGNITATKAEVVSACSGSADLQALALTILAPAATGADTGVAYTGSGGAFVRGISGAGGYVDLAQATGDGWTLTTTDHANGGSVDTLEKVVATGPGAGRRIRISAVAATGATNVLVSACNEEVRRAKMGYIRSLKAVGATGANEYIV